MFSRVTSDWSHASHGQPHASAARLDEEVAHLAARLDAERHRGSRRPSNVAASQAATAGYADLGFLDSMGLGFDDNLSLSRTFSHPAPSAHGGLGAVGGGKAGGALHQTKDDHLLAMLGNIARGVTADDIDAGYEAALDSWLPPEVHQEDPLFSPLAEEVENMWEEVQQEAAAKRMLHSRLLHELQQVQARSARQCQESSTLMDRLLVAKQALHDKLQAASVVNQDLRNRIDDEGRGNDHLTARLQESVQEMQDELHALHQELFESGDEQARLTEALRDANSTQIKLQTEMQDERTETWSQTTDTVMMFAHVGRQRGGGQVPNPRDDIVSQTVRRQLSEDMQAKLYGEKSAWLREKLAMLEEQEQLKKRIWHQAKHVEELRRELVVEQTASSLPEPQPLDSSSVLSESQRSVSGFVGPPDALVPRPDEVMIADPRAGAGEGQLVGVIGFCFPGKMEKCDRLCRSAFLASSFDLGADVLQLQARGFSNAEAAFQALKFWSEADQFRHATGEQALKLKRQLQGREDYEYGGYGSAWLGMLAILRAKFTLHRLCADALLRTGSAYLLHHDASVGRDSLWSDNGAGDGTNWLGLQLMLVRDELRQQGGEDPLWTKFLQVDCRIDLQTGHPLGRGADPPTWPSTVRTAAQALTRRLAEQGPLREVVEQPKRDARLCRMLERELKEREAQYDQAVAEERQARGQMEAWRDELTELRACLHSEEEAQMKQAADLAAARESLAALQHEVHEKTVVCQRPRDPYPARPQRM